MKTNIRSILALASAGALFTATCAVAEPSQADLLKQAKITRAQAQQLALEKVPGGKIQAAELENEHHALVWSFDIAKPNSKDITEVLINARTGKIVAVDVETPADQAKEKAADQKNGAH